MRRGCKSAGCGGWKDHIHSARAADVVSCSSLPGCAAVGTAVFALLLMLLLVHDASQIAGRPRSQSDMFLWQRLAAEVPFAFELQIARRLLMQGGRRKEHCAVGGALLMTNQLRLRWFIVAAAQRPPLRNNMVACGIDSRTTTRSSLLGFAWPDRYAARTCESANGESSSML